MNLCLGAIKIFTGNANKQLVNDICKGLDIKLGACEVSKFSDGEINLTINETVRGCDVFLIQPTHSPVNDNIMELLIMIDAVKRASAGRINAVIPYYGYARQDRKTKAREPITSKLVADLLTTAGADRIVTMDLHAGQIQGYFDIPVDHLSAIPILAHYFEFLKGTDTVIVSPDLGGVTRARSFANILDMPIAIIEKRRPKPNVSEVMHIIGEIKDKTCILIDDMIDTAGTITNGANALIERGAKDVYACCTHAVLSGPAMERIDNSAIKELITLNTIDISKIKPSDKIKMLSVAPVFGEAIRRIYEEISVSKLFD